MQQGVRTGTVPLSLKQLDMRQVGVSPEAIHALKGMEWYATVSLQVNLHHARIAALQQVQRPSAGVFVTRSKLPCGCVEGCAQQHARCACHCTPAGHLAAACPAEACRNETRCDQELTKTSGH